MESIRDRQSIQTGGVRGNKNTTVVVNVLKDFCKCRKTSKRHRYISGDIETKTQQEPNN